MNTSDSKTKEIWGRKFKIVKNGLDEAEVFSFVGGLIDQNNALASKLEQLDSLRKLAESTVIEANKQAESIIREAEEEANAIAALIIAEAEEQARIEIQRITADGERKARQSAEERITAAEQQGQFMLTGAEEKAKSIKTNASDEAERLIAEAKQNVVAMEQQAREMLKAAEEKAESIKVNGERKANKIMAEAREKLKKVYQWLLWSLEEIEETTVIPTEVSKDTEQVQPEPIVHLKAERKTKESQKHPPLPEGKEKKVYQGLLSSLEEIEETTIIPTEVSKDTEQVQPEPIVHLKAERKTKESQKPPPLPEGKEVKESPDIYEGIVELVITPPLWLDVMLQLHRHLRDIPNIEISNLGVSAGNSMAIRVSLENPTPLRKMLEDLPEVEATAEARGDAGVLPSTKKTGETALVRRIIVTTKKQTN